MLHQNMYPNLVTDFFQLHIRNCLQTFT